MSFSQSKQTFPLIILLCISTILFTACNLFGGGTPLPHLLKAPASQQIYTMPETGISDFDTLDPALAHDTASLNAIQMIFTGLVQLNDKLEVQPQLAASWQVGADGVTWIFHLKPNLKFSDGTPLTSQDVAYSIDRALQPATQSTVAPIYLALIKDSDQLLGGKISTLIGDSLLTPDANTISILTNKKAAYFLDMLTYPCSFVVEKGLITKYGETFTNHLIEGGSSGPFKVSQYIHGQEIDFIPNNNYYNAKPQLQHVRLAFYQQASTAYTAYQHHMIDETELPSSQLATAHTQSDFVQVPQLWINYYTMNYLVKPFDNVHIRQAFALAINKTQLANTVWKGTAIATNHIVPQGMPGYNSHLTGPDGTQGLSGNATKAKSLLQLGLREEGWSSVVQMPPITLTYAAGASNFDAEVAMMVSMWQNILGITVATQAIDYNTLLDRVTAATNNPQGLQFWGLAWVAEYPDPQDWLSLQFGNSEVYNNMNYGQTQEQQAVQQQLQAADSTMTSNLRISLYQKAEQQLVNDVAWMPVEQVTRSFLRSPAIVGIVDNGMGITPPDDWSRIYRVK
ncbi:MAG TPA: peptide ABC transporter substrate-binding protein [Ktedonobacter sp.]|nr:peptide ABC transporter substrate-binding protein [Ktedonobacter sp.]